MNFDLTQLLQQGPVRELLLNQVTKHLGVTNETGGNLLTKGLSMILGGMSHKASSTEGANSLINLIRNTNLQGNPLDILMGKTNADSTNGFNLLEVGKNLLPSLFGDRTDVVTNHLATSTDTSPAAAKGILGMLLPIIFSFFKDKISSGLGLSNFTNLLAEQTRAASTNLDAGALGALGFANKSFSDVLSNVAKVGTVATAAHTATAKTATTTTTRTEPAKSPGLSKWLIGAGIVLAALFGIKSCSDKGTTATAPTPAAQTATQAPAAESVKVTEGLGNLAWEKTDKDLTVSGTVQNDGIKANILDAFKGLASGLPLVDKLTVDAKADKFSFDNFAGLANLFKDFPGVNGAFANKVFNLMGTVNSEDAKTNLVAKAKEVLGNAFSVNADKVDVKAAEAAKVSEGLGDFAWLKTDKDLTVSGTVQNEGIKANILDAFKGLAAGLPLVDKLTVDAKADKFSFDNFAGLANLFKEFPGVNGSFADKVFNLIGEVNSEDAKTGLVEKAKALLGSLFTINADKVSVNEPEAEVIADMSLSKLDLDIMFATASSDISPRYFRRLNALAQYIVENKRTGEIAGYTDNVGDAAANQKLSEERANAVRNYLIKQGVPAESLTAIGYGQENPIADNSTEEGRTKNRRIEFNVR